MGGRGGASGFNRGGNIYQKLDIPKDGLKGKKFDASNLQGTEKQIQYAQSIINDSHNTLDNQIERSMDQLKYCYSNAEKYGYKKLAHSAAQVKADIEIKKKINDALNRAKTAKGIINNKFALQHGFPEQREALAKKYEKEYEEKYKKKFKK